MGSEDNCEVGIWEEGIIRRWEYGKSDNYEVEIGIMGRWDQQKVALWEKGMIIRWDLGKN